MSIKLSDDPHGEFKALINLMKDPTDTKKDGEDPDGELDSEEDDLGLN